MPDSVPSEGPASEGLSYCSFEQSCPYQRLTGNLHMLLLRGLIKMYSRLINMRVRTQRGSIDWEESFCRKIRKNTSSAQAGGGKLNKKKFIQDLVTVRPSRKFSKLSSDLVGVSVNFMVMSYDACLVATNQNVETLRYIDRKHLNFCSDQTVPKHNGWETVLNVVGV